MARRSLRIDFAHSMIPFFEPSTIIQSKLSQVLGRKRISASTEVDGRGTRVQFIYIRDLAKDIRVLGVTFLGIRQIIVFLRMAID